MKAPGSSSRYCGGGVVGARGSKRCALRARVLVLQVRERSLRSRNVPSHRVLALQLAKFADWRKGTARDAGAATLYISMF